MKLRNPFNTTTRELFRDTQFTCWECGGNGGGSTELHHIVGRESNSALNAAVLCHECHSHVGHTDEEHKKYLTQTMNYLISIGYKLTEKDVSFIEKHHKYYQNI